MVVRQVALSLTYLDTRCPTALSLELVLRKIVNFSTWVSDSETTQNLTWEPMCQFPIAQVSRLVRIEIGRETVVRKGNTKKVNSISHVCSLFSQMMALRTSVFENFGRNFVGS